MTGNPKPKVKASLLPSKKAKQEIKAAAKSLGSDMTYEKVRELTGYSLPLIRESLRNYRKPLANGRPAAPSRQKPKFIQEIERSTGLQALMISKRTLIEEWYLLSPTGLPVVRIVGYGDLAQFIKVLDNSIALFQGLTDQQIKTRREARTKVKKEQTDDSN